MVQSSPKALLTSPESLGRKPGLGARTRVKSIAQIDSVKVCQKGLICRELKSANRGVEPRGVTRITRAGGRRNRVEHLGVIIPRGRSDIKVAGKKPRKGRVSGA